MQEQSPSSSQPPLAAPQPISRVGRTAAEDANSFSGSGTNTPSGQRSHSPSSGSGSCIRRTTSSRSQILGTARTKALTSTDRPASPSSTQLAERYKLEQEQNEKVLERWRLQLADNSILATAPSSSRGDSAPPSPNKANSSNSRVHSSYLSSNSSNSNSNNNSNNSPFSSSSSSSSSSLDKHPPPHAQLHKLLLSTQCSARSSLSTSASAADLPSTNNSNSNINININVQGHRFSTGKSFSAIQTNTQQMQNMQISSSNSSSQSNQFSSSSSSSSASIDIRGMTEEQLEGHLCEEMFQELMTKLTNEESIRKLEQDGWVVEKMKSRRQFQTDKK